jgi:putative transposase
MKKRWFTEQQFICVFEAARDGRKLPELASEIGVYETTLYTWELRFGGMDVSDAQRLRRLEEEHRQLKTSGCRSQSKYSRLSIDHRQRAKCIRTDKSQSRRRNVGGRHAVDGAAHAC